MNKDQILEILNNYKMLSELVSNRLNAINKAKEKAFYPILTKHGFNLINGNYFIRPVGVIADIKDNELNLSIERKKFINYNNDLRGWSDFSHENVREYNHLDEKFELSYVYNNRDESIDVYGEISINFILISNQEFEEYLNGSLNEGIKDTIAEIKHIAYKRYELIKLGEKHKLQNQLNEIQKKLESL